MSPSTGADLRALRERKPLVHQITNYVVMNEIASSSPARPRTRAASLATLDGRARVEG